MQKVISFLTVLAILVLVGCSNKIIQNDYKEINIDNYFMFQATAEMVKTQMQRNEPFVGMYKSDKVLLIYEYGSSVVIQM